MEARRGGSGRGALGRGLVCKVSRMSIGMGRLYPRRDGMLFPSELGEKRRGWAVVLTGGGGRWLLSARGGVVWE